MSKRNVLNKQIILSNKKMYRIDTDEKNVRRGNTCIVYNGFRVEENRTGEKIEHRIIMKEFYPSMPKCFDKCIHRITENDNFGNVGELYISPELAENDLYRLKKERFEQSYDILVDLYNNDETNNYIVHPIEKVYANNTIYSVIDYNNGMDYEEYLEKGNIDLKSFIIDLRHIAVALSHLHKIGVVHLDIKPENIFKENETVKFLDVDSLVSKERIVDSKFLLSYSDGYSAPEIISIFVNNGYRHDLGRLSRNAEKADFFSIGAMFYRYLYNEPLKLALRDVNQSITGIDSKTYACLKDYLYLEELEERICEKEPNYSEKLIHKIGMFFKKTISVLSYDRFSKIEDMIEMLNDVLECLSVYSPQKDDAYLCFCNTEEYKEIKDNYSTLLCNGYVPESYNGLWKRVNLKEFVFKWDNLKSVNILEGAAGSGKTYLLKYCFSELNNLYGKYKIRTYYCTDVDSALGYINYISGTIGNNEKLLVFVDNNEGIPDEKIVSNCKENMKIICTSQERALEDNSVYQKLKISGLGENVVKEYCKIKKIAIFDEEIVPMLDRADKVRLYEKAVRSGAIDKNNCSIRSIYILNVSTDLKTVNHLDEKMISQYVMNYLPNFAVNGFRKKIEDSVDELADVENERVNVCIEAGILKRENGTIRFANSFNEAAAWGIHIGEIIFNPKYYDNYKLIELLNKEYGRIELKVLAEYVALKELKWSDIFEQFNSHGVFNKKQALLTMWEAFIQDKESTDLVLSNLDFRGLSGIADILSEAHNRGKEILFKNCMFDFSNFESGSIIINISNKCYVQSDVDENYNIFNGKKLLNPKDGTVIMKDNREMIVSNQTVITGYKNNDISQPVFGTKPVAIGYAVYANAYQILDCCGKYRLLKEREGRICVLTADSKSIRKVLFRSVYEQRTGGCVEKQSPVSISCSENYIAIGYISYLSDDVFESFLNREYNYTRWDDIKFTDIEIYKIVDNELELVKDVCANDITAFDIVENGEQVYLATIEKGVFSVKDVLSNQDVKVITNIVGKWIVHTDKEFVIGRKNDTQIVIYNLKRNSSYRIEVGGIYYPESIVVMENEIYLKTLIGIKKYTIKRLQEGKVAITSSVEREYDVACLKKIDFSCCRFLYKKDEKDFNDAVLMQELQGIGVNIGNVMYDKKDGILYALKGEKDIAAYILKRYDYAVIGNGSYRTLYDILVKHSNSAMKIFLDYICDNMEKEKLLEDKEWMTSCLLFSEFKDKNHPKIGELLNRWYEKESNSSAYGGWILYLLSEVLYDNREIDERYFNSAVVVLKYAVDMGVYEASVSYNQFKLKGKGMDLILYYTPK